MRSFTITAPLTGEVRDVPMPEPGPGQVVVKVAFCGICGTDYHIFRGESKFTFPLTGGHEASGVIAALGPAVTGWSEGDRVAIDPTLTCGRCVNCLRRRFNHCDNWGAIGGTAAGALAEYVRVPVANLFRVGDRESLEHAAFTEPLACVAWGIERLRVRPGDDALIFGAGPIGGLLTAMLAMSPTSGVTVVDVLQEKLDVARRMGATQTFVAGPNLKAQLVDRTSGRGYDVVVDCTGNASVIEGMFQYAGEAAKIMFFGVTPPGAEIRVRPFDVYLHDWEILGSMAINYSYQQARALLAGGRIDVAPLLTRVAGLEDVADILGRPKTGSELKTLVSPDVH